MLRFPNCKINLGLYITKRRDDGYHDIETIFYPLPLKDVLEVVPAIAPKLYQSGLAIEGTNNNNLVWKAFELLSTQFPGKISPLHIYLHKIIPMGAGLGGGSADGAFMLQLVNDFCNLQLSKQQLTEFALQLGSDCPFFIYNTPKFATGRGDQMTDVSLDLSAFSIQLICPHVHVATKAAFQMITPNPAAFDLRFIHDTPVKKWKEYISNDFEGPVFNMHPILGKIKQQLYNQGAVYAAMSGSGSAIFGVFPKSQKALIKASVTFDSFYVE